MIPSLIVYFIMIFLCTLFLFKGENLNEKLIIECKSHSIFLFIFLSIPLFSSFLLNETLLEKIRINISFFSEIIKAVGVFLITLLFQLVSLLISNDNFEGIHYIVYVDFFLILSIIILDKIMKNSFLQFVMLFITYYFMWINNMFIYKPFDVITKGQINYLYGFTIYDLVYIFILFVIYFLLLCRGKKHA